jgi:hypothetical protein
VFEKWWLGIRAFGIERITRNYQPPKNANNTTKRGKRERPITILIDEDAWVILIPIWLRAISRIDFESQAIQLPFKLNHRLRFRV